METRLPKPKDGAAQSKAPAKSSSPLEEIRGGLMRMEDQIRMALPSHIPVERFIRVALMAIQMNPQLLQSDRKSLFLACQRAAQEGLLPDGKEAALVAYKKDDISVVQYIPMVSGILKKVRNSGELSSITSQIVFERDKFRYWVDESGEHVEHNPDLFGSRGKPIGVYALAKTKDGSIYLEVMTEAQVLAVRESSRAKNGPWSGPFEGEMWRKTALRRLSKRLPMSTDLDPSAAREEDRGSDSSDSVRTLDEMMGPGLDGELVSLPQDQSGAEE
jgi:recombination protein RecT